MAEENVGPSPLPVDLNDRALILPPGNVTASSHSL